MELITLVILLNLFSYTYQFSEILHVNLHNIYVNE